MLLLYMDVHVKAAITAGVRQRGVDVLTAQEDVADRLDDKHLLELLLTQLLEPFPALTLRQESPWAKVILKTDIRRLRALK